MTATLQAELLQVVRLCIWLALLSLLFVPIERLFALHPSRIWRKEVWTDLGYYFLNNLVPNLLLVIPMTLVAALLHRVMPSGVLAAAGELPTWLRLVAVMVVGEIGFYWGHRWSHEIPYLWRFHAVHHSAEHIDFLVNTRAHPIDMVLTRLCGLVPLYVLGLAQVGPGRVDGAPILLVLVGTVWGFFVHANVRWRFGPLEWLVATPAFHHWHHTNDANRYRNYAAMPAGLHRQLMVPLAALPERTAPRVDPGESRA